MDKARLIETNITGLSFSIGEDGVWMNTSANGKHAGINLVDYGKKGGIIGSAVIAWCNQLAEIYAKEASE